MSKLIDVDALKDAIIDAGQSSKRYKIGEFWELNCREIYEVIDNVPTVDAVPVVRCRDCRYSKSASDDEDGYYCLFFEQFFQKDGGTLFMSGDYCSHGERKDNAAY